jgi:hypothetical protein
MDGLAQKGKVLENVRIVFMRNWRAYHKGQEVDYVQAGMTKGAVVELVNRGIVVYVGESKPGYQSMTMEPVQTMVRRRGRPAGSKNKPKGL